MMEFRAEFASRNRFSGVAPLAAIGAVVAMAWMLGASAAAAGEDEMVARGRQIAEAACSPCHAVGPTGYSPRAHAPWFRELGHKYPVESLQEALAEGVVVGHPEMPQVKMSESDIGAFIAYLKTIQVP